LALTLGMNQLVTRRDFKVTRDTPIGYRYELNLVKDRLRRKVLAETFDLTTITWEAK